MSEEKRWVIDNDLTVSRKHTIPMGERHLIIEEIRYYYEAQHEEDFDIWWVTVGYTVWQGSDILEHGERVVEYSNGTPEEVMDARSEQLSKALCAMLTLEYMEAKE